MSRLYAKQCASLGRPHEAATFFLAAGDPQGAVAALERAGRADAAADVAEARLLRGDPTRARAVESAASKATGARAAARWAAQGDWLRCAAALGLDAPDAGAARAAVEADVRLCCSMAAKKESRLLPRTSYDGAARPHAATAAASAATSGAADDGGGRSESSAARPYVRRANGEDSSAWRPPRQRQRCRIAGHRWAPPGRYDAGTPDITHRHGWVCVCVCAQRGVLEATICRLTPNPNPTLSSCTAAAEAPRPRPASTAAENASSGACRA